MLTNADRTNQRGFPGTPRHFSEIAGGRENRSFQSGRPARPKSGRRPDGTRHDDDHCVLARVPTADGDLYFVICEHVEVRAQFAADSDAEAIARVRAHCALLACDTMMEGAAREAGLPVTPLTEPQLTLLAVLAVIPGITNTMTAAAIEKADVLRFAYACAGFAWAQVWRSDLLGRLFEVQASGETERLTLVVQPDGCAPGPGFGLLEPGVELAASREGPGVNAIGNGRLSLVCVQMPERLQPLLLRALGTELFPIGISYRRSPESAPLNVNEIRLLTGVLECIRDLTTGAESATVEVDRRRISVSRHPHDSLLAPQLRGTA